MPDIDTFAIEDAVCVAETDKAIRVTAPIFDAPQWIPKSVVHDNSEVWKLDQTGTLIVREWFAEKQGWL
jgi:hypothetical protein